MGKMLTEFPSVETGSRGMKEMTRIQINHPEPGTETDHPPEREITRGGMGGAGPQLREGPGLERRGKENPPLQEDVLCKKNY